MENVIQKPLDNLTVMQAIVILILVGVITNFLGIWLAQKLT
jgi:hypothetical protein